MRWSVVQVVPEQDSVASEQHVPAQQLADAQWLRLAVVGTGALGSTLLALLAESDFRNIHLIDPDSVEPANLPLSGFLSAAVLHNDADTVNKAALLAAEATRTRGLHWQAHPCEVADVGWQVLREADVICCCTDSALSRVETAYIARVLGKPMLDGAVFGDGIPEGRVSWLSPEPAAACYLCGMGESSRAAVLGYAASASLGCTPAPEPASMTGTVATLRKVAATMLQQLGRGVNRKPAESVAVRLRPSRGEEEGAWQAAAHALPRSATCPWHNHLPATLEPLPWETPFRELLISLSRNGAAPVVDFAWPICTEALCGVCGARTSPCRRVGVVRRRAQCGVCGTHGLRPVAVLHRLGTTHPLAALTPRQLGLPDRHLYCVRQAATMNRKMYGGGK